MVEEYNIPENVFELFNNNNYFYSIIDSNFEINNVEAMMLFLDLVGVSDDLIEENDGTQVILNDGEKRLQIDCGGLGDFYSHSYEITEI